MHEQSTRPPSAVRATRSGAFVLSSARWRAHIRSRCEPGPDGCLVFTGAKHNGYGWCTVGGRTGLVHRLMYESLHGPIARGVEVMHSCDNPPCCNIAHLRLGTHAENMAEMAARGRAGPINPARGEQVGTSFHTRAEVLTVRQRVADGERQIDVARDMGLDPTWVNKVVLRQRWRHV